MVEVIAPQERPNAQAPREVNRESFVDFCQQSQLKISAVLQSAMGLSSDKRIEAIQEFLVDLSLSSAKLIGER